MKYMDIINPSIDIVHGCLQNGTARAGSGVLVPGSKLANFPCSAFQRHGHTGSEDFTCAIQRKKCHCPLCDQFFHMIHSVLVKVFHPVESGQPLGVQADKGFPVFRAVGHDLHFLLSLFLVRSTPL